MSFNQKSEISDITVLFVEVDVGGGSVSLKNNHADSLAVSIVHFAYS